MPITENAVTATNWILAAVSILLVAGRYAIRLKVRKRVFLDDLFQGVALVALLGFAGSIQAATHVGDRIIVAQQAGQTPSNYDVIEFRKLQNALSNCFYIMMWAVKLTFLFFYRLLFDVSPTFMKAWWATLVFLILTFWVPVALNLSYCGPADQEYNPVACDNNLVNQRKTLIIICVVQIVTDLVIMALPLFMLRKLQMRLLQKIGLGVVFCVAFVTVAMDILRTVKSYKGGAFADSFLYSILEGDLTVIVACVPTYRHLFGIKRKIPKDGAYLDIGLAPTTAMGDGTLRGTSTRRGHSSNLSLDDMPLALGRDITAKYTGAVEGGTGGLESDDNHGTSSARNSPNEISSESVRHPSEAHMV